MDVLGSQVGQFVARRQAEAEVRASESRLRAMLEAALDAVVVMDHRGRVLDWNHAAETTFGWRAHEAVGHDMADLIVPPGLRASHRKGLARFLETERPVILDRRLELTGMHKNGTEFPVELTITRIGLPGAPTFTGYLRDITDRKRDEAELKASRARLVEVADAERRRIQRNLHDGAQQRLTSVLLTIGRMRRNADGERAGCSTRSTSLRRGFQEIRELASGLHPSVLLGTGIRSRARGARAQIAGVGRARRRSRSSVAGPGRGRRLLRRRRGARERAEARGRERGVVTAAVEAQCLLVEVEDDGAGGADPEGDGLRGLVDRVEALGGTLDVDSPTGGGTRVVARLPVG